MADDPTVEGGENEEPMPEYLKNLLNTRLEEAKETPPTLDANKLLERIKQEPLLDEAKPGDQLRRN